MMIDCKFPNDYPHINSLKRYATDYSLLNIASSCGLSFQTFLVWQLAFSTLLLGTKYSRRKIGGCLLVAAGVVVAVARYFNLSVTNILRKNMNVAFGIFCHMFYEHTIKNYGIMSGASKIHMDTDVHVVNVLVLVSLEWRSRSSYATN